MSLSKVDPVMLKRLLPWGQCKRCHSSDMVRYHVGPEWASEALICIRNGCNGLTLHQFPKAKEVAREEG